MKIFIVNLQNFNYCDAGGMRAEICNTHLIYNCLLQTKFFDSGDYAMAKAKGGSATSK